MIDIVLDQSSNMMKLKCEWLVLRRLGMD